MLQNNYRGHPNYYSKIDGVKGAIIKQFAGGLLPATLFYKGLKQPPAKSPKNDQQLTIEIVSHCWQYAHLLRYQLSSIVLHAPADMMITMTVYYCESDLKTLQILRYFGQIKKAHIRWNWQNFPKEYLFRRAIGRNHAALKTQADWIWFTDCDSIFHHSCFSSLAQCLPHTQSPLVFPLIENRSAPLPAQHHQLNFDVKNTTLVDINPEDFVATPITRATGPLQIVKGDVARALGYCKQSEIYQKPARRWCKALEDRVYRWFLGTQGEGLPIKGVYRIQHQEKGRYTQGSVWSWIRHFGQNLKTTHFAVKR
ncbi:glycosyltransferase family 2 protein [uncultured Paraglaciecola sp.]|uniref:glycosyltransferase family 2 protein n=1 Tax=uncultured Paraglaciecola sp. TaxID=1765024 RepID=UPI0030DC53C5|tara:strand:- start:16426 stop:17358 length:933 start_codon:yes stop_codon:yes gene_type:complete